MKSNKSYDDIGCDEIDDDDAILVVVARRGGPNPPISGNSRFRTCTQGGHSATGPRHRHRTQDIGHRTQTQDMDRRRH